MSGHYIFTQSLMKQGDIMSMTIDGKVFVMQIISIQDEEDETEQEDV